MDVCMRTFDECQKDLAEHVEQLTKDVFELSSLINAQVREAFLVMQYDLQKNFVS